MRCVSSSLFVIVASAFLASLILAVTSPMPHRPGYGLGSWIPKQVVDSMRKEAAIRVELMTLENIDAEARSVEREISIVADNAGPDSVVSKEQAALMLGQIRDTRREMMSKKLTTIQSWLGTMQGHSKSDSGAYTTFASGSVSPVDWSASTTDSSDRSFDSINIGVHYVRNERMDQDGSGESHAERVSRELKNNSHTVMGRVTDVQREAAKLAAEKTAVTATHHRVAGTLLISAFATHRQVKQFTKLKTDADKLWAGWNYQNPTDRIPNPLLEKENFTNVLRAERARDPNAERNTVAMVSEMYLGSVIVGLVHFVQKEVTDATNKNNATVKTQSFHDEISDNVRQAQKMATHTGSTTIAIEEARKMAKLGSSSGLDVQIDLVSIGYIPVMKQNSIHFAIDQFKNFDPALFAVPSIVKDAATSTALAAIQSNMASVIDATISALDKIQGNEDLISSKSLMDAFVDFSEKAQAGKAIGAPIGMNVHEFTKLDVIGSLANKYLNTGIDLAPDV